MDIDHIGGPTVHTYTEDGPHKEGYHPDQGNALRLLCHRCNAAQNRRDRNRARGLSSGGEGGHNAGPAMPTTARAKGAQARELIPPGDGHSTVCAPTNPENHSRVHPNKSATRAAHEAVDYAAGSPEMAAAGLFEDQYREWALEQVRSRGYLTVAEAVNAGAEVAGCSIATVRRYLAKMTSSAGPLVEVIDMMGARSLALRDGTKNSAEREMEEFRV